MNQNQRKVLEFPHKDFLWLTNPIGDTTDFEEIPEEVDEWRKTLIDTKEILAIHLTEWMGEVVVRIGEEYGILLFDEISHQSYNDWEQDKKHYSQIYQLLNSEGQWTMLKNMAQLIQDRTNYQIYIGEKTGYNERHEVGLFVPVGTDIHEFIQIYGDLNQITTEIHL